jgi:hypothetical protein
VKGATASINFFLQLDEIVGRLDDNARQANVLQGDVVVLERFQLPAGRLLVGQDLAHCGVNFVEFPAFIKLHEKVEV